MNFKCDLFEKVQYINERIITDFILYSLCKLLVLFGVCYLYHRRGGGKD